MSGQLQYRPLSFCRGCALPLQPPPRALCVAKDTPTRLRTCLFTCKNSAQDTWQLLESACIKCEEYFLFFLLVQTEGSEFN